MMSKKRIIYIIVLLCGVFSLSGCLRDRYQVRMQPKGASVQRTLTAWVEDDQTHEVQELSAQKVQAFKEIYALSEKKEKGHEHIFHDRFQKNEKNGFQGSLSYFNFDSNMGRVTLYSETAGADGNLAVQVEQLMKCSDDLTDLLIVWFESELKGVPEWEKVHFYFDQGLRKDLKNILVHIWLMLALEEHSETLSQDMLFRGLQFLIERDYLADDTIDPLFISLNYDDEEMMIAYLKSLLKNQIGLSSEQTLSKAFDFLENPEKIEQSLEHYITNSTKYRDLAEKWKKEKKLAGDQKKPSVLQFVLSSSADIMIGSLFSVKDKMDIELTCPVRPFQTNGDWDEEAGKVVWSYAFTNEGHWSHVSFALWSEPDVKFQKKHFGRIVLRDRALYDYILWGKGLRVKEADEWDMFLEGLKPDKKIKEKIQNFRFVFEQKKEDSSPDKSLADKAIDLILNRLEEKK